MSVTATKDLKNALQLYRDCLRLADYVSTKQGNRPALRMQVRKSFEVNLGLTDPKAIETAKEAAVRGLSNYYVHEAQKVMKAQGGGNDGSVNELK